MTFWNVTQVAKSFNIMNMAISGICSSYAKSV